MDLALSKQYFYYEYGLFIEFYWICLNLIKFDWIWLNLIEFELYACFLYLGNR